MIEGSISSRGRITIPPEVRDALGLRPGDMLRYEIEGDHVILSRGTDEHGADDLVSDDELRPIIEAALADDRPTYPAEEVFARLRQHIETLRESKDAA